MDLDCLEIARAKGLEPGKKQGPEILFICPNHNDRHASLSLNPDKNCWICHPCGAGGNAWALVAFLIGCDPSDKPAVTKWLKDHGLLDGKRGSEMKFEETYVYEDEDGNPQYRVERYLRPNGKKTFLQSRFESGQWKSGIGGIRRVPYHLPELLSSKKKGVVIAEGEKDVDALREWGILATCNSGGAEHWRPDFSKYFKNRRVFIIPDNDEAGERHARDVARSLLPVAKEVRIVRLT